MARSELWKLDSAEQRQYRSLQGQARLSLEALWSYWCGLMACFIWSGWLLYHKGYEMEKYEETNELKRENQKLQVKLGGMGSIENFWRGKRKFSK